MRRPPRPFSVRYRLAPLTLALAFGVLAGAGAPARGEGLFTRSDDLPASWDPWYLGYETEPAMDAWGRIVGTVQSGTGRLFSRLAPEKPGLAAAWEFPVGVVLLLAQHEVGGHGSRAREYDLGPSYGFSFDLSAWTSIDETPPTNESLLLLSAGGVESDLVLSRRVFLDLNHPEGTDGAKVPLGLMAKLDLTLYVSQTPSPRPGADDEDFTSKYQDGNDIAFYLVSRQAQRVQADPAAVWEGTYAIDFGDRLLDRNYDAVRVTALWNLLDPMVIAGTIGYFRDHLLGGGVRARAPALRLGERWALLVGTRGALGPQSVSRFLDVYLRAPFGLLAFYVRDLDSSTDRSWGGGARLHGLRLGSHLRLSAEGDWWQEPDAVEGLYEGTGWNAALEIEASLAAGFGLQARGGSKSAGHLPGLPLEEGTYLGFGVTLAR